MNVPKFLAGIIGSKVVNQPTSVPTNKMKAVLVTSIASVITFFATSFFGVNIDSEVAVSISSVIVFLAGYFMPEKDTTST